MRPACPEKKRLTSRARCEPCMSRDEEINKEEQKYLETEKKARLQKEKMERMREKRKKEVQ